MVIAVAFLGCVSVVLGMIFLVVGIHHDMRHGANSGAAIGGTGVLLIIFGMGAFVSAVLTLILQSFI